MFLYALYHAAKLVILLILRVECYQYVVWIDLEMTICNYSFFYLAQFVRSEALVANKLIENAKTCIISEEKFFGYCHFVVTLHREQHKAFI